MWLPCRDFATQVQRIIALGFNTVKIPFSFNDLYGLVPNNYTETCTQVTAQQLQVSQSHCLHILRDVLGTLTDRLGSAGPAALPTPLK